MLSIILVTFNSGKVIRECLESIRTLDFEDYEIILVDNNSQDDTLHIVLGDYWKGLNLLVVPNTENVGLSRATNQAFKLCSGDFILLSNPDIIFNNGLRQLLKYLAWEYPDCIIGPDFTYHDGSLQRMIHRKKLTMKRLFFCFTRFGEMIDSMLLHKSMLKDAAYQTKQFSHDQADVIDQLGGLMMLKRSSIEKLGFLYDERLVIYFGDVDLSQRAKAIGIDSRLFSDVKFQHDIGHSYKSENHTPWLQRFAFSRDMRRFSDIHQFHTISLKLLVLFDAVICIFLIPLLRGLAGKTTALRKNLKVSTYQIKGILTSTPKFIVKEEEKPVRWDYI